MRLELRRENDGKQLDVCSYVELIHDALQLNRSVCLARHFHLLRKDEIESSERKVFVDIWLVRPTTNGTNSFSSRSFQANFVLPETSNRFDVTCLYMLQLATILCMVKPWKTRATLRVFVCVDAMNDNIVQIQQHLEELLRQLRITAQTRMISWENVKNLLASPSARPSSMLSNSSFVDVNDTYVRGVNELIRQQTDNTSCLFLYLPRPPRDRTLYARYVRVLDVLSMDLPPVMLVHGVSSVTCTQF